jgi:uncharacterized protein YlxW (UPF0749 family)
MMASTTNIVHRTPGLFMFTSWLHCLRYGYPHDVNQHTVSVPYGLLTARQAAVAALKGINNLTKEVEKLSKEIEDLRAEVAAETDEDVRTGKQIELQQAHIRDLEAALAGSEAAIQAAKDGEAGAVQELSDTLDAVREITAELRADNPIPDTEPVPDQPYPDNSLPGDQPVVNPL